jgi:hypothetical protein
MVIVRLIRKKWRRLIAYLARTIGHDQACITSHARSGGIQRYELTKQEFNKLEIQAIRLWQ